MQNNLTRLDYYCGVLILGGCLVVGGQVMRPVLAKASSPPSVVSAREFRLTDGTGKVRGVWKADASGLASFALLDKKGTVRGGIAVTGDGQPMLMMADANQHARAVLRLENGSDPCLCLSDADMNTLLSLSLENGSPALRFLDKDGKPRTYLGATPGKESSLLMADKGKVRVQIGAGDDQAVIGLEEDERKPTVKMFYSAKEKNQGVETYDTDGNVTAALTPQK